MAEGSPELPNSLPQLLPQTNLSVPETVKDSVCGLDSPRSGCQGLFVTGRKGVPSNGVQNSNLQEQTDTAVACLGIASDNISSLSVKIKSEQSCVGTRLRAGSGRRKPGSLSQYSYNISQTTFCSGALLQKTNKQTTLPPPHTRTHKPWLNAFEKHWRDKTQYKLY